MMTPQLRLNRVSTLSLLAVLAFLFLGISSIVGASTASAASCGVGKICGGTGSGHQGGGGGNGGSGTSHGSGGGHKTNPGSGSSSGSGSGGSSASSGFTSTKRIKGPHTSICGTKGGKAAVGVSETWSKSYTYTASRSASPGSGWKYEGLVIGGGFDGSVNNRVAMWSKMVKTNTTCLWPSMTVNKSLVCSISYSVELLKTNPDNKVIAQKIKNTSYKQGSKDYNSCITSSGSVNASAGVSEYGFYRVYTWQKAVNAIAEIPTTINQWTGTMDKPKIVSLSAPYTTSKKQVMTSSLDCKVGWSNPGQMNTIYWEESSCMGDVKNSYICVQPTMKYDPAATGNTSLAVKTNETVQSKRDGLPRKIVWNQSVKGNNISVKSYKTIFHRTGSPYSAASPEKNLFELNKTKTGKNLIKQNGNDTAVFSGKLNSLFSRAYTASNPNGATRVEQELRWSGTKNVKSGRIVSINASAGTVKVERFNVTIPTSGKCKQAMNIQYVRAIMDQMN